MKWIKALTVFVLSVSLVTGAALAQATGDQKPAKKLTCCEKADADGKECRNKCCVAAHRGGKSCEKCNPGKEDLEILKKRQKAPSAAKS
jgi:hypothetical protein